MVPELTTRFVPLDDWMLKGFRYDRERRILELQLKAGGAYQHRGVPVAIALELLRSEKPSQVVTERIDGTYRFERVRVQRQA
jgi:KTSC domain